MISENRVSEILGARGTLQYLDNERALPFAKDLGAQVKEQSINSVLIECKDQTDYSINFLWKRLIQQFKSDDETKSLIEKAIRITQDEYLYSNLTLRELGGLFDDVLGRQIRTLAIVLLTADPIQIDQQLLKFVDDITSLPLITETQWCFIFSSRELLVVLGLLTPEDYFAKGVLLEKHKYQGEYTNATDDIPENGFLIIEGVKVFELDQPVVNIGRSSENHLVIDDPRVSRSHAQLRVIEGRFVLFDLNSTGGTFVNDRRVSQTILYPGDNISLAGVALIFGQDNPPPRHIDPVTAPLQAFQEFRVEVKSESGTFRRQVTLDAKEWVSIGNTKSPTILLDFIHQPINFIIYRTGLGNCLLINNSEPWSISFVSKNQIDPVNRRTINPILRLVTTLTNKRVLFLESSLEARNELEIQFPDTRLYVEIG